ncbi:MAG TPA: transposase [Opitutaceae bacterium]|jgi:putative transposase|nr:transposase [Opitutaceae bacterium]
MSRTVNGERLFGAVDQEIFRRQLWAVADYCGVEVLTWTILSNHFHVLTRVPQAQPVGDEELLRRYQVLYPKPTKYRIQRLEVIKAYLQANAPEGEVWRRRQLAQMGDISAFMKLLKQRFSVWFNKHHKRYGTLWSERFKSILVEPKHRVIEAMAAYIDLNCVRACICSDPKDYRFCGYAEALAGSKQAKKGLLSVIGGTWPEAQAAYRQILFSIGAGPNDHAGDISEAALKEVLVADGKLPLAILLRHKLVYFTSGAVLGGRSFVEEQLMKYRQLSGRRKRTEPYPVPDLFGCGGLLALRGHRAGH